MKETPVERAWRLAREAFEEARASDWRADKTAKWQRLKGEAETLERAEKRRKR